MLHVLENIAATEIDFSWCGMTWCGIWQSLKLKITGLG